MKLVTLEASVKLAQEGTVAVSITIGDGQIGGGVIKMDGKKISVTPVSDFVIGNAIDLKGKTILIKNIVSDENEKSNKTSVRYLFKQNIGEQTFISKAEVEHDKDIIGYHASFLLN